MEDRRVEAADRLPFAGMATRRNLRTPNFYFSARTCPAARPIVPSGKGRNTACPCLFHVKTPGSRGRETGVRGWARKPAQPADLAISLGIISKSKYSGLPRGGFLCVPPYRPLKTNQHVMNFQIDRCQVHASQRLDVQLEPVMQTGVPRGTTTNVKLRR